MRNQEKTSRMTRVVALVLAGLIIFGVVASAIMSLAYAEGERTQYTISATMLKENQAIRCEQTTVCGNPTDGRLSQLFFSVYPNVLRRETTLPADEADLAAAFPNGYAPGGIQFVKIWVNGQEASWGIVGQDEAFLRVDVDLAPGETAEIVMQYDILLADCALFTGAGQFDWRLVNAFPTLCAMENGVPVRNGALSAGTFAWAEAADWKLTMLAPQGYTVIAGGTGTAHKASDGWVQWTREIKGARDMAVVISRRATAYANETDGRVAVFANDAAAGKFALETAQRALRMFEDWFGAYPWPDVDIVMSDIVPDFVSAPGVILLRKDLFAHGNRAELEYALVSALVQQYFGEYAGVNPYDEPWLRESMGGLCALLYYGEAYGPDRQEEEYARRIQPALEVTVPGGVAADSSAAYFNSRSEYEIMLRGRGVAAVYELYIAMGQEDFLAAMRMYLAECGFGKGTIGRFVDACDGASGGSWGRFLTDMLANIGE